MTHATFDFPVLLGDIGGTNARFGIVEAKGAVPRMLSHESTRGHPHPSAAIRASLDKAGSPTPRSAILAIAGRVDSPTVRLTNADWLIEGGRIGADFGLSRVTVVNDYVPVAAGAAGIEPADLTSIGDVTDPGRGWPRLVLGPGTGFGAAVLIPYGDRLAIVSTEAGHTDFGPADTEDEEIWPAIERLDGRVTVEALLSGPGLSRLHFAIASTRGGRDRPRDPATITEDGLSGKDPHACAAITMFAKLLGRYCGDLALTFLARGGVYIGGGIAPRIIDVLNDGRFRAAFEHKPPFVEMMRAIPTSVITVHDPALNGLAALASEADRFVYHGQVWTR